jgi:hypothetical protein
VHLRHDKRLERDDGTFDHLEERGFVMSNPMQCEARVTAPDGHRTATTISFAGEVDLFTSATLLPQIRTSVPPAPAEVVFDLAGLTFADSSLLKVLDTFEGEGYDVGVHNASDVAALVLGFWRPSVAA